jgi:hypothetical protein
VRVLAGVFFKVVAPLGMGREAKIAIIPKKSADPLLIHLLGFTS